MLSSKHPWKLALSVLVFLFCVVTPSKADKVVVRGGSTYGDNTGFASCVDNINNSATNCEGFVTTSFIIGGTTYSGALFAFLEPGGSGFGVLDIISLPGNSTLTLNLVNTSLPTGIFACGSFGNNSNVAQDSTPSDMTGLPCTPGSSSGGYLNLSQDVPNVQANFSANSVTFVNSNSTGIAVFTEDGNIQGTTATPEPGSALLLAAGVIVFASKFRGATGRRQRLKPGHS